MDADTNDITSNGLNNSLTRDGQGVPTANLPMAGFRHTGVQDGQSLSDYASVGQAGSGAINWVVATGTADAITATYTPPITALVDGQLCFVRASAPNATTTPTFSPNGLTARIITRSGGSAVGIGDIPAALAEIILRYNLANTRWELLNPAKVLFANGPRVLGASIAGVGTELALGTGLFINGSTLNGTSPVPGAFKNLSIKVATNTTVAVAADFVTTTDGTSFQTTVLSGTINLGTNGAANALDTGTIAIDSWYAIWAIAKADGTTAALASLSFTAPTMPTGYTFKARVGAVQTIHASATLYGTWQLGRRAQYVVGLAQTAVLPSATSGVAGNTVTPGWVGATLTRFVPPTASRIIGTILGSTSDVTLAAPNNSYGGVGSTTNTPPAVINNSADDSIKISQFDFVLESTQIFYAATGVASRVFVMGWEDNI